MFCSQSIYPPLRRDELSRIKKALDPLAYKHQPKHGSKPVGKLRKLGHGSDPHAKKIPASEPADHRRQ